MGNSSGLPLVPVPNRSDIDQNHQILASAWLAAIIENSDDAIVSKTLDGVITSWNGAAKRLFGFAASEAIGQSITIIIPDDRLPEEATIIARIRSGLRVEHFETVRRRKDGSLFDVSVTVSPVRDETGAILGASKILRDITERKKADEGQNLPFASRRLPTNLRHLLVGPCAATSVRSRRLHAEEWAMGNAPITAFVWPP